MARARTPPAKHPRATSWLTKRTTGDILVLIVAGTICVAILATGAAVAFLAFVQPERNLSNVMNMIGDIINTMIGLLAGFLAGRTDTVNTQQSPPKAPDDDGR